MKNDAMMEMEGIQATPVWLGGLPPPCIIQFSSHLGSINAKHNLFHTEPTVSPDGVHCCSPTPSPAHCLPP